MCHQYDFSSTNKEPVDIFIFFFISALLSFNLYTLRARSMNLSSKVLLLSISLSLSSTIHSWSLMLIKSIKSAGLNCIFFNARSRLFNSLLMLRSLSLSLIRSLFITRIVYLSTISPFDTSIFI